jgi:glyoxylase-like metal-dependent hydrolase (beta-lactamase superfamily II)
MKWVGYVFSFFVCLTPVVVGQSITTHHVTGNIYMLEGNGGNIGVSAGEDGLLIIDDQYANMAEPIQDALKSLNKGDLKMILNTHFHSDHTGGNEVLGQGVPIVAHDNVRVRLEKTKGKSLDDAAFRESLPVVTYSESASVHFNGEALKLIHYPHGHTDGDSVIYFTKSNVVHMGDHFFVDLFPFIDVGSGGNVAQFMKNVEAVLDTLPDDVKIIPGHGRLATKQDLKKFLGTIQETTAIIRKGMGAGTSKRDLQNAGLPEKYASHGTGFVNTKRWIGIVFDSYSE